MYYYELFSHPDRFPYRAHILSGATCVFISCLTLTFLSPFLITYYTGDYWTEDVIYSEQPRLSNTIKYLIIIENDDTNNRFFQSSYATLNRNFQTSLLFGDTLTATNDTDGDGLIDQIRASFDLVIPTTTNTIHFINIWLIFQYDLVQKQRISMETMALINIVPPSTFTPSSNMNLTVYGKLILEQKQTIKSSGSDYTYNSSIIDATSSASPPDINAILDAYFSRDYYTSFQTQYTWMTPRTTSISNVVTVNAVVNVGRQAIRYKPGFWQAFKWGWIQYVCALIPFMMIFNRLKLFVYSNHLVRTFFPLPQHRHKA